jgi:hypothetical protein
MSARTNALIGWGGGAVMIVAIIGGLMLIGGPGEARAKKQDAARLTALQKTAFAISCYSDNVGALPYKTESIKAMIDDKNSEIYGSTRCRNIGWETDPVSKAEFEYNRTEDHVFEICAEFERPSRGGDTYYRYGYVDDYRNVLIGTLEAREQSGRYCYVAREWKKELN